MQICSSFFVEQTALGPLQTEEFADDLGFTTPKVREL
jgi:hypothetical protein